MAAELGILSLTQLQKLSQLRQQQLKPAANWSFPAAEDDDDSWEVRAFGSTTWPPRRTYTCSFCNREFRSAQALGGHMNVHRRDRARLRENTQGGGAVSSPAPSISFSSLELDAGGGLCLFYPTPSPSAGMPCTRLPMSAMYQKSPVLNLLARMDGSLEGECGDVDDGMVVDELDLELRL